MKDSDFEIICEQLADLIVQSNKIMVFTGAGISTESGIPDFRGKNGIWTKLDPSNYTLQKFLTSEENRKIQWHMFAGSGLITQARPNNAHMAIVELEKLGKLDCVVTQNVDNLHQMAGNSPGLVFELHGNMQFARCLGCDTRFPMPEILKSLEAEGAPACKQCGGILKPDAVFFGESLPHDVLSEAARRATLCDLCLVIGSTLIVYPAAYVPLYAADAGARLVIINLGETPLDVRADLLIDGKAGEIMTSVMGYVRKKMQG